MRKRNPAISKRWTKELMPKNPDTPWWPYEHGARPVTASGEPIVQVGCSACAGKGKVACNVCSGRGWTVAVIVPKRVYR